MYDEENNHETEEEFIYYYLDDDENNQKATGNTWTEGEVFLLIETYRVNENKFCSPQYNASKVWNIISKELEKNGVNKTGDVCNTKWRNLKKIYQKHTQCQNSTGQSRRQWKFFDVMHEVLYKKPEITPVATASSSGLTSKEGLQVVYQSGSNTSSPNSQPDTPNRKRKGDNLSNVLRELDAKKEKRHQERMEQKEKIFNFLKNYMS